MRIDPTRIGVLILGFLLLCPPEGRTATTTAGGETVTWDFQGIPPSSFFGSGSCGYVAATNFHLCEYGFTDPPYGNEITFSSSLKPTSATFPSLTFGYYDIGQQFHFVREAQGVGTATLSTATSFYIPASAKTFALIYHSNGSGGDGTNIQINWNIANYDPLRANLLGGDDISPDTEYCDESPQPGQPRMRKYRNKKGAGPGT